MSKPIIICVDDEKIILDSLKKELDFSFKNMLSVESAECAKEALELLDDLIANNNEIPIIISDWLMPDMKGDELLIEVHKKVPDTRTIMLTGQATTEGIGNAVNNAKLYRYIAKPWQSDDLELTVTEAFKSYYKDIQLESQKQKLIELNTTLEKKIQERTKELEILQSKTLKGAINILINVLSKSQPHIFEKALRMRRYAKRIIKKLETENSWEIEIACLLSQIGCIELPEYTLNKILNNEPFTQRERNYFLKHPKKAEYLLSKIPYLQNIAVAISKHLDDESDGDFISEILRITSDFDDKILSEKTEDQALKEMKRSVFPYKDKFLSALQLSKDEIEEEPYEKVLIDSIQDTKIIHLTELKVGDVIGKNLCNRKGTILIPSGKEVTEEFLASIRNLFEKYNLANEISILKEETPAK